MTRMPYELSTSGVNILSRRLRQRRRRLVVGWSLGGAAMLLAGMLVGFFMLIRPAAA